MRWVIPGAISLICAAGGAWQVHQWARVDRISGAREEIRTQAHALGAVTQTGIETLARELVLVMDEKLRKGEGAEFDREILDIALWTRKESGAKPVRTVLGLNSNYITPLQDNALRSKGTEPAEIDRIERVFDGQWVISPQPTTELGQAFLVAVPASRVSPAREAVVAHVRAAYFQRFFKVEAPFRAVLLNSDGRVLMGGGAQDEASLGRAARASIDKFTDIETGLTELEMPGETLAWWGGYRKIRSNQFTVVLATSPRSAIAASTANLWSDPRVWKAAVGMALACLLGIGAAITTAGAGARVRSRREEAPEAPEIQGQASKLDEILNDREEQIVPSVAVSSSSPVGEDHEPGSSPRIQMPIRGVAPEPQMNSFVMHSRAVEDVEPARSVAAAASFAPAATETPWQSASQPPAPEAPPVQAATLPLAEPVPAAEISPALAALTETLEGTVGSGEDFISSPAETAPPALTPTLPGADLGAPDFMAEQRWWVHNGAHAIGPMPPAEIAGRLFAQDLDFDCECWPDGPDGSQSTIRLPIASSGLFLPQGPQAPYPVDQLGEVDRPHWVFVNGQGILGPCTTDEVHRLQAPQDAYVCFRSTINGWMPMTEWLRQNPVAATETAASVATTPAPAEIEPTARQADPTAAAEPPASAEEAVMPVEISVRPRAA